MILFTLLVTFSNLDIFFELKEQLDSYKRFDEILEKFICSNLPLIICQRRDILQKCKNINLHDSLDMFFHQNNSLEVFHDISDPPVCNFLSFFIVFRSIDICSELMTTCQD